MMIQDQCYEDHRCEDHCRAVRCYEDRAWCRSCAEQCFPEDEESCSPEIKPATAKKPSPFDRIAQAFPQWVSQTWLPGLARISKAIQGVKKE